MAEELTLKTNEITRKKSDYLEGTYAVHGIEEVMNPDDVVILINPFPAEVEKIRETLVKGVGLKVFAVASGETIFPTVKVPDAGELSALRLPGGRLEPPDRGRNGPWDQPRQAGPGAESRQRVSWLTNPRAFEIFEPSR